MRIHIIGGPGSGKTTLAHRLAVRLGIPSYEVDDIALKSGEGSRFRPKRPLSDRLAEVDRIAAEPAWITNGTHLWWTDELLRAADIIVWLDVTWPTALRRIVVRHLREYLNDIAGQHTIVDVMRTVRYPHLRHLTRFIPWAWGYYRRDAVDGMDMPGDIDDVYALSRAMTAHYLRPFRATLVRYTGSFDLDAFVNNTLSAYLTASTHARRGGAETGTLSSPTSQAIVTGSP